MTDDTRPPLVVVKVGGSLLGRASGVDLLRKWLLSEESQSFAKRRVLLSGGGAVVDGLRLIDEANQLDQQSTHWAAIEMLEILAALLADELKQFQLVDAFEEILQAEEVHTDCIFAPGRFLREVEPNKPGARLEIGWQTTSDSIAARLAECLQAPLILVKSALPYGFKAGDWRRAGELGYVDPQFHKHAVKLPEIAIRVL